MSTGFAQLFSDAFSPEYFVLACTLVLLGTELRPDHRTRRRTLLARLGVVGVAWGCAFAIYRSTPLFFEQVPTWGTDLIGGLGLAFGFLLIRSAWRARGWGPLVPEFSVLLLSITLVHSVVTPFWDISSHVLYTTVSAGYLSVVERRFGPLLIVPVGMVASRPLVGAHTWLQSVTGFVVAALFVLGLAHLRSRTGRATESRATNTRTERV